MSGAQEAMRRASSALGVPVLRWKGVSVGWLDEE